MRAVDVSKWAAAARLLSVRSAWNPLQPTKGQMHLLHLSQMVVVTDARFVNVILGPTEGLNKGMEPDNADRLISVNGHRSLFSSDTNSKYWRLIRKGTTGAFQFKNIR